MTHDCMTQNFTMIPTRRRKAADKQNKPKSTLLLALLEYSIYTILQGTYEYDIPISLSLLSPTLTLNVYYFKREQSADRPVETRR